MTDTTIRDLTAGSAIGDTDLFVTRQGADTEDKSVTGTQVKTYAATPPGGSTTQIQYNNAGAFGGITNATVENGCIRLPNISPPTAPAAGGNLIFGREVAGRSMPAFIGPSGLDSVLQPFLGRNNTRLWQANGNANSLTVFGATALTATGTATAYNVTTSSGLYGTQRRVEYLAASASQAVAGFRYNVLQLSRTSGFTVVCRWAPATGMTNANNVGFCGVISTSAAPSGVTPSGVGASGAGMGWDEGDTNVQFMHRLSGGSWTKIDLGASFPKPSADRTLTYEVCLFSAPGGDGIYYEVRELSTGAAASGYVDTEIPALTTLITVRGMCGAGLSTTAAVGCSLTSLYIETDY